MAEEIKHKDLIGNPIKVGDIVVVPTGRQLSLGKVEKLNPKMINVTQIRSGVNRFRSTPDRRYPSDLLVVDDPKITIYMLKLENK